MDIIDDLRHEEEFERWKKRMKREEIEEPEYDIEYINNFGIYDHDDFGDQD